ncbi:hypothetical protein NDU88_001334 [Pleurodeles waltl]|uniref:Uncharacterized protein n=1 Tax=Pleurodeles waltl TaxID=8319 RepID=A0AAV7VZX4_PLEWA|nr:hypothetical protein NDU88_001334 [Pleurodeles waltl]
MGTEVKSAGLQARSKFRGEGALLLQGSPASEGQGTLHDTATPVAQREPPRPHNPPAPRSPGYRGKAPHPAQAASRPTPRPISVSPREWRGSSQGPCHAARYPQGCCKVRGEPPGFPPPGRKTLLQAKAAERVRERPSSPPSWTRPPLFCF